VRLQQLGPVLRVGVEVRDNSQVLEQHPVPSPVAVLLVASATASHVHHQARSGMFRRDGPRGGDAIGGRKPIRILEAVDNRCCQGAVRVWEVGNDRDVDAVNCPVFVE
jgi:hypothetical protein